MSLIGLGVSMPMPSGVGVAAGGEFSPLNLSPLAWYDASDTGTITESSGSVSQWDDKSGNGYDLTQATSSAQPKTGTATINSLNVLEYDLTNNNQRIVNSSVPLTGTSYTMFAVYDINSNDTLYTLLSTSNSNGYAYIGWSGNTGSLHSEMSGLSLHINGVEFTGTNRDDVYTAVGNAPVVLRVQFTSSTYDGLSFGYNLSSAVTFGFGTKVAEAFVAASPTAQEITDAETYLADKWGITLS